MKTDDGVPSAQARSRPSYRASKDARLSTGYGVALQPRPSFAFSVCCASRRLSGPKFRRQVPVGPYIVDFLCVGARLVVEADGSRHGESLRDAR